MSEIAKCRCGAEAVIRVAGDLDTLHPVWHFVTCATGCHISGPWCDTEGEAIAAWNELSSALAWLEERVRAAGFDVEERP